MGVRWHGSLGLRCVSVRAVDNPEAIQEASRHLLMIRAPEGHSECRP